MNNLFSSVNFLSSLPALLPFLPPQAAINKWFFTLASFFPCSTLLPSPLPKTPAHQPAVRGGSSSVSRLSPLTTLQSYHPALTIHLPPSSLHHRERACLFVRECLLGRAVFSGLKPLMFPLQQALKTLLLAVWDLLHGKMSVWSRVKEKRSERERARGPPRARGSQFIAGDVSEDNRWQLFNPLNPTSKDDKIVATVWQFDRLKWAAAIRRGLSLIWNSKRFVESLFTHCYWTFKYFTINYWVTQHSHPVDSDLSWF